MANMSDAGGMPAVPGWGWRVEESTDDAGGVCLTTLGVSMQRLSTRARAPSDVRGRQWAPEQPRCVCPRRPCKPTAARIPPSLSQNDNGCKLLSDFEAGIRMRHSTCSVCCSSVSVCNAWRAGLELLRNLETLKSCRRRRCRTSTIKKR